MGEERRGKNLVLVQVPLPLQGQGLLLRFLHQPVIFLQCVAQLLDQLQSLSLPSNICIKSNQRPTNQHCQCKHEDLQAVTVRRS